MKKILSLPVSSLTKSILAAGASLFLTLACSTSPKAPSLPAKGPDEVSIVSFNVENLFDTTHDKDKDDYTFLPLSQKQSAEHKAICAKVSNPFYRGECLTLDWNEDVLKAKMKNLSEIILGIDEKGPDILVVLEVENINVLSKLNKEYLEKAGYQTVVLLEGQDTRGIDVGLLSRFPVVGKPVLHKIPFTAKDEAEKARVADTRGILEVTLKLPNGEPLTVFGGHFPSQANPRSWRAQSIQFMQSLMKAKGDKAMTIGAGDLNITHEEEEEAHFFKDASQEVLVSHFVGCQSCPGSHNYKKTWSFLDAQLYSKTLAKDGSGSYELEPETIDVIRYNPLHLYKGKYPKRFDPEKKEGVSDHFPLYARLKKRAVLTTPDAVKN